MKKLFQKSLLVAAGLLVGASAWADATSIYERGTTTAWSNDDLAEWTLSGTAESSIVDQGLKFAKTAVARTEYTYTKSLTTSDNAIVTLDLSWIVENANGSSSAGCYFTFGDVKLFWCGQDRNLKITIGGAETTLISGGATSLRGTTFDVDLTINKATKTVSYSVSNSAYNSGAAITGEGTASVADVNSIVFGWSRGGQQNTSSQIVKSILISEEVQTVTTANYTINYKLGDAVVKTVSASSVVGAEITANMAIDGEGDYAGNHYVIVADAVPSMTLVAGENVLDVPVRAPYAATLKVTTTVNGTASEETFDLTETDTKDNSYSYAFSKYVKSGDVYYVCDADKFVFNGTFTDGEVIEKAVSYTNADENIVFFKEAENVAGKNENCSWGGSGYVGAQNARNRGVEVGTLPAGHYLFTVNIFNANRRSVVLRQSTNDPMASVGTSSDDLSTGLKSAYFALTEETADLWINGANSGDVKTNQSEDYDYVVIRKIDEMVIVGDFADTGWNVNGIAMTQSSENEWTVVVENFEAEAKNYEYKALYHGTEWYGKSNGQNQNFDFSAPGYGAGTYTLTFTANTSSKTVEMTAEKQVDYTVVGCFNINNDDTASFFGTAWDVANNDNNLVSNGDGTYSKTFYNVALEAGTIYYKVVEGHSWDAQWGFDKTDANPDGNADYGVNAAGTYDITFTFDPINKLSNGYNLTCEVTATPTTVAKTISAAGYATYCSPYALDFSEVTGLKAYIATQNGDSIKFVRVNSVPAGTGVLLKGEGEYNINVVASAEAVEGNLLVGVLADTKVAAGNFVLMNGNDGVGFYKTTKEFTVGANTAYLEGAAGGARMFIGFDENTTTTAINAVAAEQMNGEVYNLKGQRVAQPTKGLYIVNGKKVVLK